MKTELFFIALLSASLSLSAQDDIERVRFISGAASVEDLDETVMENYDGLLRRKCEINYASRSRLLSSGLFSSYQVASILDYRSRFGDILSAAELAVVDGFDSEYAEALAPFLSFSSSLLPGAVPGKAGKEGSLLSRFSLKDGDFSWGLKGKYGSGRVEGAFAARTLAGDPVLPPSGITGYMRFEGKRGRGRLIIGDYNARFGQGLGLWSGFSLSGLSSVSSFAKRPSGISPSWSYTQSGLRGVAAEYFPRRLRLTYMASVPELGTKKSPTLVQAADISWFGRMGEVSATVFIRSGDSFRMPLASSRFSAGGRICIRGIDFFGEGAYDLAGDRAAVVGGTAFPVGENWRFALLGRAYGDGFDSYLTGPVKASTKASDEVGAAAAAEAFGWSLSGDWCLRRRLSDSQLKLLLNKELTLSERWLLKIRIQERLRNYDLRNKTGFRADLSRLSERITYNTRIEMTIGQAAGFLSYFEAGNKGQDRAWWLRGTLFCIDNWDDRIYVYERDAPGSFNVPAYYGRGWALSAVGSLKKDMGRTRLKLNLRASTVQYTFMKTPKPSRYELKAQASLEF